MVKKIVLLVLLNCYINTLVYGQDNRHQGIASDSIQERVVTYIDEPPFFEGELQDFIQEEMEYPLSALNDSVEGMVVISFIVDTLGNTINHEIKRGIRKDLDMEALRIAKKIKYARPALQKGRPIRVPMTVPFFFKIDQMCGTTGMTDIIQVSSFSSLFRFCKNQCGGSSTELWNALACADMEKNYIDYSQNVGMLEHILFSSKKKRHFQQKIGGVEMSCIYVDSMGEHHYIVIISRKKGKGIIDLSEKREYWPKREEVKQMLNSLIILCPLTKETCD